MKKSFKKLFVPALGLLLALTAVVQASADTYYEYYGLYYTILNNETVAIADWDDHDTTLSVPATINGRRVVSVINYALMNNEVITTLDLSHADHLNRIGTFAFYNCRIENQIVFPPSLTIIDNCAFQDCDLLPSVNMENTGLLTVPKQCFYQCDSLETAVLSNTTEKIDSYAFADCPALEYVAIPSSVSQIAPTAFMNDPNLTLGVWYDSYGYHYAVEKNIPYTLLDGVKLGDVDGNGIVNINDVTEIQRYLAELDVLEGISLYASDANRDGVLDISDATAIQMYLAEYVIEYPIGEIITQ